MNHAHIGTDFYSSFIRFLLTAKQQLMSVASAHGLTGIQAATLIMLDDTSSCPMKRIGQIFHCDASNVTGIIDGLEHKGLVSRENDPNDRRIKTIEIRPAGKKLQQEILSQLAQDNDFLFAPLNENETEQLAAILTKLAQYKKLA